MPECYDDSVPSTRSCTIPVVAMDSDPAVDGIVDQGSPTNVDVLSVDHHEGTQYKVSNPSVLDASSPPPVSDLSKPDAGDASGVELPLLIEANDLSTARKTRAEIPDSEGFSDNSSVDELSVKADGLEENVGGGVEDKTLLSDSPKPGQGTIPDTRDGSEAKYSDQGSLTGPTEESLSAISETASKIIPAGSDDSTGDGLDAVTALRNDEESKEIKKTEAAESEATAENGPNSENSPGLSQSLNHLQTVQPYSPKEVDTILVAKLPAADDIVGGEEASSSGTAGGIDATTDAQTRFDAQIEGNTSSVQNTESFSQADGDESTVTQALSLQQESSDESRPVHLPEDPAITVEVDTPPSLTTLTEAKDEDVILNDALSVDVADTVSENPAPPLSIPDSNDSMASEGETPRTPPTTTLLGILPAQTNIHSLETEASLPEPAENASSLMQGIETTQSSATPIENSQRPADTPSSPPNPAERKAGSSKRSTPNASFSAPEGSQSKDILMAELKAMKIVSPAL